MQTLSDENAHNINKGLYIMTQVKKAFQPIIDILEANKDNPVSAVLARIMEIAEAKVTRTQGDIAIYDKKGKVVALFDYFLKRWMPLVGEKAVEFGPKAGTTTGFQGMSKIGLSLWTSAQRKAKAAELALLTQVAKGEIQPSDIPAKQAEIEESRKTTPETYTEGTEVRNVSDLGFATQEEVTAYLEECKVKVGEAPVKEATQAA